MRLLQRCEQPHQKMVRTENGLQAAMKVALVDSQTTVNNQRHKVRHIELLYDLIT